MARGLAWFGVIAFAISWFVPVVSADDLIDAAAADLQLRRERTTAGEEPGGPDGSHGWGAARFAWDLLRGRLGDAAEATWKAKMLGATCLTNLLMLAAILVLLLRAPSRSSLLGYLLLAAAALDASWLYLTRDVFRSALSAGYYLWLGSFVVVGITFLRGHDQQ